MTAQLQFFDGRAHRALLLGDEPVLIGGRTAAIRVPGATVTHQHARVYRDGAGYWVADLGGDGVWVNGRKVERHSLANRDKVQVGALALEYFEDEPGLRGDSPLGTRGE